MARSAAGVESVVIRKVSGFLFGFAMADRKVTVFEDEAALSKQLVQEVTQAAKAAISAKGSFSTLAAR